MEALHTEIFDCRDGQYATELPDNHPPYVTHWGRWRDERMPYKRVRGNEHSSRSHMVARLRQIYPHLPLEGTKPPPSERVYYGGYKVRSYAVFLGRRKTTILKIHGGRIVEEKVLQDLAYKGRFLRGRRTLPFLHAHGVEEFMLSHNFWHFRRKRWAARREKYRHLVAKSHGYRIVPYG